MEAFKCLRTGLLYPADYYEEWGRKYGVGLGPVPVSEAFVNMYTQKTCGVGEKEMFPFGRCFAQVQLVTVTDAEYNEKKAITDLEDPSYSARNAVMQARQVAHGMVRGKSNGVPLPN